jgi:hypothetical protein
MIKVKKEKQQLDEMAIQVVSSMQDDLPFRVAVKSPDHPPPHAHLMDNATGRKNLGQFLIPATKPRVSSDIKDYKQGITDEMRTTLFLWMRGKNKFRPKLTNWEILYIIWHPNETH